MLDRFKKQQPSLASTIKIQVVNLKENLKLCSKDQQLNQIMLIPPRSQLNLCDRSSQPPLRIKIDPPALSKTLNHAPTSSRLTHDWSTAGYLV